ncbi:hypothetical protein PG996_008066 [Apiospora saccharicola]|uniref:Uncharacterized protein n=1 Tax=Apiospora saccharicola TaxID=335842 RepID=A0ABR1UWU5_9PEZI
MEILQMLTFLGIPFHIELRGAPSCNAFRSARKHFGRGVAFGKAGSKMKRKWEFLREEALRTGVALRIIWDVGHMKECDRLGLGLAKRAAPTRSSCARATAAAQSAGLQRTASEAGLASGRSSDDDDADAKEKNTITVVGITIGTILGFFLVLGLARLAASFRNLSDGGKLALRALAMVVDLSPTHCGLSSR